MAKTKTDLISDVKSIVYSSEAKIGVGNMTAGEMDIAIETLTAQVASYTSRYSSWVSTQEPNKEVVDTVRGKLKAVIQDSSGDLTLQLTNPLSGGQSEVRCGRLVQTDGGLVAKFEKLKLIE